MPRGKGEGERQGEPVCLEKRGRVGRKFQVAGETDRGARVRGYAARGRTSARFKAAQTNGGRTEDGSEVSRCQQKGLCPHPDSTNESLPVQQCSAGAFPAKGGSFSFARANDAGVRGLLPTCEAQNA